MTYSDYDPLKRRIRTQDAGGRVVNYDYDVDSNLIKLGDTKNNVTHWTYDGQSRQTRKTYADGTYEGYGYQSGRLTSRRDGRGRVTSYGYDAWGRLSYIDYPTMPDVSIEYDNLDRPISMTDGMGQSTYGYDGAGRLTSVDGPFADDTVSYGYDTLNRRATMQINGAYQTSYGYDARARLQSITSAAGAFNYGYVGNTGMLQTLSLPNGTQTSYGYDGLKRLTQMQTLAGQSNISHYAYAYDTMTHRRGRQSETSQIEADPTQVRAYGYDDVDQLTSETVSQNGQTVSQSTLGYDPMGNRTGAQSTSATTQSTSSYTSNKLNQLIALSTTTGTDTAQSTLGYDQSGNLTNVTSGTSGTSYSYDDANRLSAVEVAGQSKSTFLYDGMSRLRVSRDFTWQNGAWVQTGEVRRVYDGMEVVQERDASNVPICTYTRSGNIGGILARTDGNGHLYYHYDGRGNVSQLTDASAAVTARYSYDAFGNTSSSGTAASLNRYRFSTKEQIGGLYSYGYRFYSPGLGRWINRDPIKEKGGLDLYGFVNNNPTTLVDRRGLAYFGKKPFLFRCGLMNPVSDHFNIEFGHEQLFYEDEQGGNTGFDGSFPWFGWKPGQEKVNEDPNNYYSDGIHYDDDLMREAAANIGYNYRYNLIGNNCQTWADRVKEEYWRLKDERGDKPPGPPPTVTPPCPPTEADTNGDCINDNYAGAPQ